MNPLKLKNNHMLTVIEAGVLSLPDWLDKLLLHGKESRMRTRFIKTILPRIKEIHEEKKKLLEAHAEKNGEGQVLYLDSEGKEVLEMPKQGKYKMTPEEENAFGKEFSEYLQEDFIIDVTEANREEISTIGSILSGTEYQFSGRMSDFYDEWCTAFENVWNKNVTAKEAESALPTAPATPAATA